MWLWMTYHSTKNFTVHVVTGFSEQGKEKIKVNKNLVIPEKDANGKKIQGIGAGAFSRKATGEEDLRIETLTLPENVKASCEPSTWQEVQG